MALYLGGSERQRIILNNVVYRINLLSTIPTIIGIRLLSSEGCILKDSNGVYLTSKESE